MDTSNLDFSQVVRESACSMLNDPGVLSEFLVAKALARRHKGVMDIQNAKEFIEDYLVVLCESRASS